MVGVRTSKGEEIGRLSLNLMKVMQSPFHQSFPVKMEAEVGRLSFDCKMAQDLSLEVTPLRVQIELEKDILKLKYSYVLKVFGNDSVYVSERSAVQLSSNVKLVKDGIIIWWPEPGPTFSYSIDSCELDYVILHFIVVGQNEEEAE